MLPQRRFWKEEQKDEHVRSRVATASFAQSRPSSDGPHERICLSERDGLVEGVEVCRVERSNQVAHEVEAEAVRDGLALRCSITCGKSGFRRKHFSTVRSPNRVLTPLESTRKSAFHDNFHLLFLLPKSSFGRGTFQT
jgi:hypothetical protein